MTIPRLLEKEYIFPNPLEAPESGLLAWGGDLHPNRLIQAYYQGIFPWFSANDPILWWSPDPRLILKPSEFYVSKSLKKSAKKYTVEINRDFEKVIKMCQSMRKDNAEATWITDEMLESYVTLHHMGHAKSIECYEDGELVGGLYGIVVGSVFCGESMFSKKRDASKLALWKLCEMMIEAKADFIDCQMPTEHLLSLGAQKVSRQDFIQMLNKSRAKRIGLLC